jgi:hypothetical protein
MPGPVLGSFFNNIALVLDRYFVHTIRIVTGKDGNALNEVEMICDSLMKTTGSYGNNVVGTFRIDPL